MEVNGVGRRDSEADSVVGGESEVDGGGEVRLYHDSVTDLGVY